MSTLGQRIRAARLSYGMSQAELARRVHISKTAMNDIEHDRTADPGFSVVQRIAKNLGLSLQYFAQVVSEGPGDVSPRRAPAASRAAEEE